MSGPHHVVVIGGGFAGLETVHRLAGADVRITIVDRRNHHLFQPLLYQVATASLATSEIAWPIRHLFRRRDDVTTLLAEITGIDTVRREVALSTGEILPYDTLVVATGATHAYFGHDDWEPYAPGLKTLEDATTIRRRILTAFEHAEAQADPERRAAHLTFVVIGAGPTGVELAGTIAELARATLPEEFRRIDTRTTRVVLVEAGPRILPSFDADLADYAHRELQRTGVEARPGARVTACTPDGVVIGAEHLPAATVIWAAGVRASPAGAWLGARTDRAGRVEVEPDLSVPGHPEIFVIGDTASVMDQDGKPVPGIAPAAKQQGRHVAATIKRRLAGDKAPRPFAYSHAGSLATVGKRVAIIDFGRVKLKGWLAWWLWGLAHIYFLIGVRNRLSVALSWLWIHARDQRSARLITQRDVKRDERG
ncbi:NAD(P)/FAD-dependent oxidoreductase [Bosea sp. FBZP-16]|uniref:NAD(P)/FAD-dependent oxidoreductase n=1 Tax=Bosea sp. FBZP-16 TaxID=2065382 RepID=UPI000C308189|nr:NAD(P)/FAD-dependent oxidoreductase [Bosea sp. FBZP-16]